MIHVTFKHNLASLCISGINLKELIFELNEFIHWNTFDKGVGVWCWCRDTNTEHQHLGYQAWVFRTPVLDT